MAQSPPRWATAPSPRQAITAARSPPSSPSADCSTPACHWMSSSKLSGVPAVDIFEDRPMGEAFKLVPEVLAREVGAIGYRIEGNGLTLACAEPLAEDEVRRLSDFLEREIAACVLADPSGIERIMEAVYPRLGGPAVTCSKPDGPTRGSAPVSEEGGMQHRIERRGDDSFEPTRRLRCHRRTVPARPFHHLRRRRPCPCHRRRRSPMDAPGGLGSRAASAASTAAGFPGRRPGHPPSSGRLSTPSPTSTVARLRGRHDVSANGGRPRSTSTTC